MLSGTQFYVGIGFRDIIEKNNYQSAGVGYGSYLICFNGYTYSHHNKDVSGKQLSFTFTTNDIIIMEVSIEHKYIKWTRQNNPLATVQLEIDTSISQQLYPCVLIHSSKVKILDNIICFRYVKKIKNYSKENTLLKKFLMLQQSSINKILLFIRNNLLFLFINGKLRLFDALFQNLIYLNSFKLLFRSGYNIEIVKEIVNSFIRLLENCKLDQQLRMKNVFGQIQGIKQIIFNTYSIKNLLVQKQQSDGVISYLHLFKQTFEKGKLKQHFNTLKQIQYTKLLKNYRLKISLFRPITIKFQGLTQLHLVILDPNSKQLQKIDFSSSISTHLKNPLNFQVQDVEDQILELIYQKRSLA